MSLLASEGGVCLNVIGKEAFVRVEGRSKTNEFLESNKGFQ
jgi:hypothetical protein